MKIEDIVKVPQILLPSVGVSYNKWAVIACDQFTSKKEYWQDLEDYVGKNPSTLNMIFPEVYLSENNTKRINKINDTMDLYLKRKMFKELKEGFIFVVRNTHFNERRLGIVLSIDLEQYSFESTKFPIRATEGTIIERIPPRVKIRENAPLEFPHIMLLIDDKEKQVIEPLFEMRDKFEMLYDFDLNQNGGHIQGYFIDEVKIVTEKLNKLLDAEELKKKYKSETPFLFAVGDGNHSLATAKTCWDKIKESLSEEECKNHPARYALVEVVNLYDQGLTFEPIHRVVKNVDADDFMEKFLACGSGKGASVEIIKHSVSNTIKFGGTVAQSVGNVDKFIADYKIENPEIEVDYIHGEDELLNIIDSNNRCVGIILEKLKKDAFFPSIVKGGSLPRKTFSMGEAIEKRYYIEGRRIK